jgi:hypothetical protein
MPFEPSNTPLKAKASNKGQIIAKSSAVKPSYSFSGGFDD